MTDQPEALRVAHWLERDGRVNCYEHPLMDAARLLREQHEEIERLRAQIKLYQWLRNGGGLCSKPLDADIAAIVHKNLDSLYVEDPPDIDAAMGDKP